MLTIFYDMVLLQNPAECLIDSPIGPTSEPKWSAMIVRSSLVLKLPIRRPLSETTARAEMPLPDMLTMASNADTSGAVLSTCRNRQSLQSMRESAYLVSNV